MSPWRRHLVKGARTVHLYVTLFTLALILFFSVTGFLLNHEDWVGTDNPTSVTKTGNLPTQILREPDKLAIVEALRNDYGAVGAVDSIEVDPDQIRVVFKRAGTRVDASIQRETGKAEVLCETRGLVGLFLDLHRGKSTGSAWSLIIDLVCIALFVVATTGIIVWWSLKGRGRYGGLIVLVGTAVGLAVYHLWVP